MIGKIIKGQGFSGALNYLFHGNKDRPKQAYEARLIGGNMAGRNARELTAEFGFTRRLRSEIKRPVVHIPLSLAPGERFSDDQWQAVAARHLRDLGYDNNQWALVRHADTDHDHVHIVTCSIRFDGSRVNDSHDYRKSALSRRAIEQDYGLRTAATTPAEARKAKNRTPAPKNPKIDTEAEEAIKGRLKGILKDAAADQPTMSAFIHRIQARGVVMNANIATTGRVSGVSFGLEGLVFKGSKVGKPYSWQGLQRLCGIDYRESRDFQAVKHAGEAPPEDAGPTAAAKEPTRPPLTRDLEEFFSAAPKGKPYRPMVTPEEEACRKALAQLAQAMKEHQRPSERRTLDAGGEDEPGRFDWPQPGAFGIPQTRDRDRPKKDTKGREQPPFVQTIDETSGRVSTETSGQDGDVPSRPRQRWLGHALHALQKLGRTIHPSRHGRDQEEDDDIQKRRGSKGRS